MFVKAVRPAPAFQAPGPPDVNPRPSLKSFLASAPPGVRVPVWCEFLFDSDTAVTAYHKLKDGPYGFLLESVVGGEQWARYSFLGSRPQGAWKLEGGAMSVWNPRDGWISVDVRDPLADLQARLTAPPPRRDPRLPRFWGGAVGYFGYDLVRRLEKLGPGPPDDQGFPEALLLFSDVVVAVDNLTGRAKAITTVETGADAGAEASPVAAGPGVAGDSIGAADRAELTRRYQAAVERLEETVGRLRSRCAPDPLELRPNEPTGEVFAAPDVLAAPDTLAPSDALAAADACSSSDAPDRPHAPHRTSNFGRQAFLEAVRRVKEYIAAGDAFQVVLSQRLAMPFHGPAFNLYRAIRTINPSPYLYHLDLDDFSIVGSSPEVLVRLEGGVVTVRPIAGTRRRGRTPEEDQALAEALAKDEKELAEHRMLVDLGRNDVGRVSEYGTVSVPELMQVERYSHVMHLCSRVQGRVRAGLSALDVLGACFPAGTVSGAPKVRAMQIIDELEPTARGPYAGAVGHLGWGGRQMDTAIAIRTMVVRDGEAQVQAGAGIVADSDPEAEHQETLNKARALLRAAEMASP